MKYFSSLFLSLEKISDILVKFKPSLSFSHFSQTNSVLSLFNLQKSFTLIIYFLQISHFLANIFDS